jgi:hypothetical protein
MILADIHNKNVFQRQFKTLMWSNILMRISRTKNDVTIRRNTKVVKAPSSKISDDANPILLHHPNFTIQFLEFVAAQW